MKASGKLVVIPSGVSLKEAKNMSNLNWFSAFSLDGKVYIRVDSSMDWIETPFNIEDVVLKQHVYLPITELHRCSRSNDCDSIDCPHHLKHFKVNSCSPCYCSKIGAMTVCEKV